MVFLGEAVTYQLRTHNMYDSSGYTTVLDVIIGGERLPESLVCRNVED